MGLQLDQVSMPVLLMQSLPDQETSGPSKAHVKTKGKDQELIGSSLPVCSEQCRPCNPCVRVIVPIRSSSPLPNEQVNSATERRVLFSIWSNYNTDDPSQIPDEYAVTLIKKGRGSGGQSYWRFTWKPETTYRLLVNAVTSGDHTIYTGYFYMPESATWKLIAQWDKAKTGGALLTGLHSFVENFGTNGNDYFEARYSNQWVCTVGGSWVEMPLASFSTTASPTKHQRYDYGAGVHGNRMYMYSGGFRDLKNIESGEIVRRAPGGIPPSIDFNTLPAN